VRTRSADAPVAVAEACALLGAGCRERPAGGDVELDFWLPADGAPDPARVAELLAGRGVVAAVRGAPERDDWRGALRAFHRPVEVGGRMVVRPPWSAPRPGRVDVVIDPGMAFGTGQHTTTRACLELLLDLPAGPLLDVGTGSGVLAIAAARLGHDPVWAVDADPAAVAATLANARANGVTLRVAERALARDRLPPAPTVLANLTAPLVLALAGALASEPPARAVVSGLRPDEAPAVVAAWAPLGLRPARRIDEDGWTALLLAGAEAR
jgi:ribosomal protein L11 methyltransferase